MISVLADIANGIGPPMKENNTTAIEILILLLFLLLIVIAIVAILFLGIKLINKLLKVDNKKINNKTEHK